MTADVVMLKLVVFAVCAAICVATVTQQNIIRPCAFNDRRCIQDVLLSNSWCNRPARGYAPSVFVVPYARFEAPAFNSSNVDTNLIIRGLDKCYVSEFYINTRTDLGVLALNCPGLNFESDRIMFQHRSLREDDVYQYWINGTYPFIRMTTFLHHIGRMDLCSAFTFADVAALPKFDITPKNRETKNHLTKDLSALSIYEQETFAYRGKPVASVYINSCLCDYGCY